MRTQKRKKYITVFLGVILLFGGISLRSRLLSEEVSISLENLVYLSQYSCFPLADLYALSDWIKAD